MMVTFVSQCEKNALKKTRRVLDAFADRIGDNTWQTIITEDGLLTVKKMLRKTASKNTAVSCHWIRSRSRSHFLWVVGNKRKFDSEGRVPVNITRKKMLLGEQESSWKSGVIISLAAGIAGLFHDFGKSNDLFQNKLKPDKNTKTFEPYRHEWISLRLFQAFVGNQTTTDEEWLIRLENTTSKSEHEVFSILIQDSPSQSVYENPFASLPKFAQLVAWLVVSHHKLPMYPKHGNAKPDLRYIEKWQDKFFNAAWNSWNCMDEWDEKSLQLNWTFTHKTPLSSQTWRDKAKELAKRALNYPFLLQNDWLENTFTQHLARLSLMLADHYYSAQEKKGKWQDLSYQCYANTNKHGLNQKLDEHNIGVALNAYWLSRKLPKLKSDLPSLGYDRKFLKHTSVARFKWQNKAFDLAKSLAEETQTFGFFGINMASTGLGKTLGNARIMYGLSLPNAECRFSVALGLRTLTLQTGNALAERLKLDETEMAVLVGSQAVKHLYQLNNEEISQREKQNTLSGSESLDDLFDEETHVEYKGMLNDGVLSKWLEKSPKLEKLLNAPVLVSTVDYLIPASEGVRGGKQIAPMLRLLTSDLVLDEPDDFGLEDMPALCRLVNWAGMLGSRVLLSTATMPPALAYALFSAYQTGRKMYSQVHGSKGQTNSVCCAWFDEFGSPLSALIGTSAEFGKTHAHFIDRRIKNLTEDKQILRKAALVELPISSAGDAVCIMTKYIHKYFTLLHDAHHQENSQGQRVSVGLLRMANISPLIAVAKALFSMESPPDYRIHLCIYHGQFPLAMRSHIEQRLDKTLVRDDTELIWKQPEIEHAFRTRLEKNHLFIVLATSVAEVGRDHDYDWAIAEPSSMRSIIQLAGRIQRHRKWQPDSENFLILSKNMKALKGIDPAYCRPGFETVKRHFEQHDLKAMLPKEKYQNISAIPRITGLGGKPDTNAKGGFKNFIQLEHWALMQRLLGKGKENNHASLWWEKQPYWCAELQKIQPFRKSLPSETFCLYAETDDDECNWCRKDETQYPAAYPRTQKIITADFQMASGKQPWFNLDAETIFDDLAQRLDTGRCYVSRVFGELGLRHDKNNPPDWLYNPILGVYEDYERSGTNYLASEEGYTDE